MPIKLSDKQKKIINLMRKGYLLEDNIFSTIKWLNNNRVGKVNFDTLFKKGIISFEKMDDSNKYYSLTELGKTINIV